MNISSKLGRAIALVALLILPLASCESIPQPAQDWVVASRLTHDLIGPRFVNYVQADDSLRLSEKATLIALVDDWDLMIQSGEFLYPGPNGPTEPTEPTYPGGDE